MLSNNVAVRASGSSTARDAAAAQEQLTRYMDNLVSKKEQQPSSDLISEVVQSQLKSGKITREQLVAHAFLLLVAGACADIYLVCCCCCCCWCHTHVCSPLRSAQHLLLVAGAERRKV
jgi:nitric oxide reductase